MKIIILIQCANLGGMEQSTVLLLAELKQMGNEVELISLNEMGALAPVLDNLAIPRSAVGYHGKWGWRSFFALRRKLKATPADALVMVGHNLMALLAIGDYCSKQRVLSLHFHHRGVKSKWGWQLVYRIAMWRFRYIIYPSNFVMKEALEIMPELISTNRTISYPIPSPIAMPPVKKLYERHDAHLKFGIQDDDKIVGNAGWLIPRKRWDVFLEVAAEVAKVIPNVRFLIAGDGPEKARLQDLSSRLKLDTRVIWLGWQHDLVLFYKSLDVMLFNSDWDAMGRTPLEAMSYGVPVVASMLNGGLSEVIDCDKHGFLFATHDVAAMSDRLVHLLQDDTLYQEISTQSRARIEEIGSPRLHALRVLQLLHNNPASSSQQLQ